MSLLFQPSLDGKIGQPLITKSGPDRTEDEAYNTAAQVKSMTVFIKGSSSGRRFCNSESFERERVETVKTLSNSALLISEKGQLGVEQLKSTQTLKPQSIGMIQH